MTLTANEEAAFRELIDRRAIEELKARYCRFIDTKQWDEFHDLFTDDCQHFLPQESGTPIMTNEQYFPMLENVWGDKGITVHHVHAPEITFLSSTEAEGIWAMNDYDQGDGPTGRISFKAWGHYHETYRKCEDGKWRISSKRNTRLRFDDVP